MANIDRPNGFRPVGTLSGAPYNGAVIRCVSTDNLFTGDLVKWASDPLAIGEGPGYPDVDRCTATTDLIVGVVTGWDPNPSVALDRKYYTGGSGLAVHIAPIDNLLLEAQADDNALDLVDVGLNVDATFTAGDVTTGASGMELDASTAAITAGLQFKVMSLAAVPGNTATSNWTRAIVKCNQSGLIDQTAGV